MNGTRPGRHLPILLGVLVTVLCLVFGARSVWQIAASQGRSLCDAVSQVSLQGMGHACIISIGEDATRRQLPFTPPLPHGYFPRCHYVVATTGTGAIPAGLYESTIIITQLLADPTHHQIGPRAWMMQPPQSMVSLLAH